MTAVQPARAGLKAGEDIVEIQVWGRALYAQGRGDNLSFCLRRSPRDKVGSR